MRFPSELRHAARRLRRRPGFTVAAVTTLGVGMGAALAIFAVVHGVVLNPLPYPDAERLVRLDHGAPGIGTDDGLQLTEGLHLLYGGASRALDGLAVYSDVDLTLTGGGDPRRLTATFTTPELASVLRVAPVIGRFLTGQDAAPGAAPVTVLSHRLWRAAFGGDSATIGTAIVLDGVGVEVVGVMPPSFGFPSRETDLWLPRTVNPATTSFGSFTLAGIGRLAPGVDTRAARDELQSLIPRLVDRFPGTGRDVVESARLTALVLPLKESMVGDVATTLWVLLGTVGLILLIAAVNVTNLLVVRIEGRQREMVLRTALGAGLRAHLGYVLAEAAWLAATSGALALGLAGIALGLVRRFGPAGLPRLEEVGLTPAVWLAALALTAAAGGLLGVLPILTRHRRDDLVAALKEGARATAGRARFRARNALIVSQTAFALVLIVGAGLMTRSFWHLTRLDTGFDAAGVLTFQISLPRTRYPTRERAAAFHDALLARLRALGGVDRVGGTTCLPLCGSWAGNPWAREDRPPRPGEIPPVIATRRVSEDYLEAMRIGLLRGRTLERRDREQRTGAVVINRRAAEKLFPGEDPLGRRLYPGSAPDDPAWYHVVGIVENAPVTALTDDPAPVVYLPLLHADASGPGPHTLSYAVHASLPPLSLVAAVRAEVRQLDAALPLAFVRPMTAIVREASARMAFTMVLLVIAAAMALFLGVVGIYSVIAYMVAQRSGEFGIRLAVGARAEDLTRMVLRQGGAMVAIGVAIGLVGALALTRFMRAMVFGVSVTDPVTYAGVTAVLVPVALLAILGPARRAARVDAMASLRAE